MSFLTVVEQDATTVEQSVVAGLKTAADYVDNVTVTEIEPALLQALLAALKVLGQDAVAAILGSGSNTPTAATPAS